MRSIKRIFVHCTAGSQRQTVNDLLAEFKRKGWKHPGYHYVVQADGKITQLLGEQFVSNGVKGYNSTAVNVAYMGGIDAQGNAVDNRTPEQKASLVGNHGAQGHQSGHQRQRKGGQLGKDKGMPVL